MEPEQLDDPVLYRQELIKVHSRRLKVLEIQASKYGLECPASIQVEIIEIKEKVAALGGEIDEIKEYRERLDNEYRIKLNEAERITDQVAKVASEMYKSAARQDLRSEIYDCTIRISQLRKRLNEQSVDDSQRAEIENEIANIHGQLRLLQQEYKSFKSD